MISRQRRRAATATIAGIGALLAGVMPRRASTAEPPVIEITAQRFRFTPADIPLKLKQPVTLAITSLDFPHGFSVPDLKTRVDLIPGKAVRLVITPGQAGVIEFVCDNFCGDGHEAMHGRFTVA